MSQFTSPRNLFLTGSVALSAVFFAAMGQSQSGPHQNMKPSLSGATGWLNTQPLALADLRGKIVLVDFWTYTCINWRRTLPYVREWARKYKDQGLVVIGVHTPEFSFEHKLENISSANKDMNIDYPVAVDNDYEIWNSFDNHYWPALYLIDAKGKVRYQQFGEGDYEEIERQIQQLLKETSAKNIPADLAVSQPDGYEAAPDWGNMASPETYLNYNRTQGFVSPGGIVPNKPVLYTAPGQLELNQWGLSGKWAMEKERLLLSSGQGKMIYRFHARDLHIVMGPSVPGTSIKFRVLIDGNVPGIAHGVDIDSNGNGIVTEQRMYHLIRQQGAITDREFQIEFLGPEVEVFVFTFG